MGAPTGRGCSSLLGVAVGGYGSVFISIGTGLTVFYGVNGAGKTRALKAIRNLWVGSRSRTFGIPDAHALIELPKIRARDLSSYRDEGPWSWWRDWAQRGGRYVDPFEHPNKSTIESALEDFFVETVEGGDEYAENFPRLILPDRHRGLYGEWKARPLVVIWATGTDRSPRWSSAPAIVTGRGRRFVNAEAELFENIVGAEADTEISEAWGALAMYPIGRRASGETVMIAAQSGIPLTDGFPAIPAEHDHLLSLDIELALDGSDVDAATRRYLTRVTDGDLHSLDEGGVAPSELLVASRPGPRKVNQPALPSCPS